MARTLVSPPVYSSFSTLCYMPRTPNDVTHVIAHPRRERRRSCLWSNVRRVAGGLCGEAVFMTSQLTLTSICLRCGFQVRVLCSVWTL